MKCDICDSMLKSSGIIPGYIEGEDFEIFYCDNCGVSRALISEFYDFNALYDSIYSAQSEDGYARYFDYTIQVKTVQDPLSFLANKEPQYNALRNALNTIDKTAKILEVGSGLGYTTFSLRQCGYVDAWGCDLSEKAVEQSKQLFGDYYLTAEDASLERYDFVFATEVIEHCPNPKQFIGQCMSMLKPGGMLLLTTPRSTVPSYEYQNIRNIWISDPPPVHLWCFSPKSLKMLLESAGCFGIRDVPCRNRKSLFGTISIATNRRYIINSGAGLKLKDRRHGKTEYIKHLVKKIVPKALELDVRYVYSKLLNAYHGVDHYVYLDFNQSEVIAMMGFKNSAGN